jgi:hypothetical protein
MRFPVGHQIMKTLKAIALNKHSHQDNRGLKRMNAKLIYLSGDAASIARLGRFLSECAKEMRGQKPFHRHFRDYQLTWSTKMADVVVERVATEAVRRPNKSLERTRAR